MIKRLAATVVVLGAFAALVSYGTLAVFTDQDTIDNNTFTNGTIDLTTSPTSAAVSFTGMMPGDSITDDVTVSNAAGSAALRYAISSTATNTDAKALKDQLSMVIKTVDVTTPAAPCDDFDGTQLYSGDLDGGTTGKLVGDSTQGAHTGDRNLGVSASEVLCFRVTLPSTTGNAYKSATTTATFTFDSEQTANNP